LARQGFLFKDMLIANRQLLASQSEFSTKIYRDERKEF
jgi:hypothetical protein